MRFAEFELYGAPQKNEGFWLKIWSTSECDQILRLENSQLLLDQKHFLVQRAHSATSISPNFEKKWRHSEQKSKISAIFGKIAHPHNYDFCFEGKKGYNSQVYGSPTWHDVVKSLGFLLWQRRLKELVLVLFHDSGWQCGNAEICTEFEAIGDHSDFLALHSRLFGHFPAHVKISTNFKNNLLGKYFFFTLFSIKKTKEIVRAQKSKKIN